MFLKRWLTERGHEVVTHADKAASLPPPSRPASAAAVLFDLISQGRVELVIAHTQFYNQHTVITCTGRGGPDPKR